MRRANLEYLPMSDITDGPIPLLLTPRAAAAALSVCERTLWAMTHPRGPIPAVRLGRAVRYSMAELQRWIATQQPQEAAHE